MAEPQQQVDKADPQKSPDAVKSQVEAPAKKAPAKKAAAKKTSSSKAKASKTASPQAKAAKAAEGKKASKKDKVDDRLVLRSGLTSVPHDVLNPAFAAPVEK